MKQFSDTIKILSHEYELVADPHLSRDRGANGECNCNDLTITLDPTMHNSRLTEVYIHEVLEAFQYHLSLELEHDKLTLLAESISLWLKENHGDVELIGFENHE